MTFVRRAVSTVLKGTSILLVAMLLAELALQVAARFAHGRGTAWRPGAVHKILCT
jgi:hypothetical protein